MISAQYVFAIYLYFILTGYENKTPSQRNVVLLYINHFVEVPK